MKNTILLLAVILAAGCANTPSDFAPKYHTASKSIQTVAKGIKPNFDYSQIKKISSSSCDSKTAARVLGDEEEAFLVLKLEAAKLNADAIVGYSCHTLPVDLINNCWASKTCSGVAVKIISENAADE